MFSALVSTVAGPCSPGTAYEFSHHSWGEFEGHFGRFGYAVGGMGAVAEALRGIGSDCWCGNHGQYGRAKDS